MGSSVATSCTSSRWPIRNRCHRPGSLRYAGYGLALLILCAPALALGARSAVVLEYHHVAEDTPPSTSVTPDTFGRHMQHLADHDFHVWPLPKIVATLRAGGEVPERTVALTFDDAYRSVYEEVFPRMQRRGWPFTVFVATGPIDRGIDAYATWDQLREMEAGGATIANHTVSHEHMIRRRAGESEREWRRRLRREVEEAQKRLAAEVELPARLFAYPYGEFSPVVEEVIRELGYVGFGQQSGALGPDSNFAALPRFPIATGFASLNTFALKVRSRPLPVARTDPDSGVLGPDDSRPQLRLFLEPGPYRPEAIRCYLRGEAVPVRLEQTEPRQLVVRPERTLGAGRSKINCTAPIDGDDDWFWYSFLWMKPHADGRWYQE